jgi:hypothetical protein
MTDRAVFPKKLTLTLEVTSVCLLVFMTLAGLGFQYEKWSLPGVYLILIAAAFGTLLNLLRARFMEVSARIDELERKLAASSRA